MKYRIAIALLPLAVVVAVLLWPDGQRHAPPSPLVEASGQSSRLPKEVAEPAPALEDGRSASNPSGEPPPPEADNGGTDTSTVKTSSALAQEARSYLTDLGEVSQQTLAGLSLDELANIEAASKGYFRSLSEEASAQKFAEGDFSTFVLEENEGITSLERQLGHAISLRTVPSASDTEDGTVVEVALLSWEEHPELNESKAVYQEVLRAIENKKRQQ